eukprot:TRINITY_DN21042_c0_g1_i1.p1 TRINITY_DN21042_c0_g1~~TRINITY_DN21042_c0_g1_i1.p1  ORF type:complete len:260 (+),score=36.42 TRINITY_DN21042_c0_g1_i1:38-817(+)
MLRQANTLRPAARGYGKGLSGSLLCFVASACCWQLDSLFAKPQLTPHDEMLLGTRQLEPRRRMPHNRQRRQHGFLHHGWKHQSRQRRSCFAGIPLGALGVVVFRRKREKAETLTVVGAGSEVSLQGKNSDDFQKLMGVCYGVAGLLHIVDLLGPNMLPAMAGAPPFWELAPVGQIAALVWCATGPIAFAATRLAPKPLGDASLAFYGLYEIGLAASVPVAYPAAGVHAVIDAVKVQLVVLAAYVYTAMKDLPDTEDARV